jgi:lipoprotein-anchoring transpeptidase ErfK/SrfK
MSQGGADTMAVSIHIDIARQELRLYGHGDGEGRALLAGYPISTALHGPGETQGSGCTPRGLHRVRAKVGAGCAPGTVFVGRRPTGEVYSPELAAAHPGRDWILTRILWLTGCEPGINRGGAVDTLRRYIYIHGCPDDCAMGVPLSHGCVRMRNGDVVDLFERVEVGAGVRVEAGPPDGPQPMP